MYSSLAAVLSRRNRLVRSRCLIFFVVEYWLLSQLVVSQKGVGQCGLVLVKKVIEERIIILMLLFLWA